MRARHNDSRRGEYAAQQAITLFQPSMYGNYGFDFSTLIPGALDLVGKVVTGTQAKKAAEAAEAARIQAQLIEAEQERARKEAILNTVLIGASGLAFVGIIVLLVRPR